MPTKFKRLQKKARLNPKRVLVIIAIGLLAVVITSLIAEKSFSNYLKTAALPQPTTTQTDPFTHICNPDSCSGNQDVNAAEGFGTASGLIDMYDFKMPSPTGENEVEELKRSALATAISNCKKDIIATAIHRFDVTKECDDELCWRAFETQCTLPDAPPACNSTVDEAIFELIWGEYNTSTGKQRLAVEATVSENSNITLHCQDKCVPLPFACRTGEQCQPSGPPGGATGCFPSANLTRLMQLASTHNFELPTGTNPDNAATRRLASRWLREAQASLIAQCKNWCNDNENIRRVGQLCANGCTPEGERRWCEQVVTPSFPDTPPNSITRYTNALCEAYLLKGPPALPPGSNRTVWFISIYCQLDCRLNQQCSPINDVENQLDITDL